MNKLLMTLNDEKIEFDNFNNALSSFLKEISEYFWNHAYINKNEPNIFVFDSACMPDAVDGFFYYLNDKRIITDEEIGFQVDIKVDYSPEEIVAELKADYGDSYLYTNAFIMDIIHLK